MSHLYCIYLYFIPLYTVSISTNTCLLPTKTSFYSLYLNQLLPTIWKSLGKHCKFIRDVSLNFPTSLINLENEDETLWNPYLHFYTYLRDDNHSILVIFNILRNKIPSSPQNIFSNPISATHSFMTYLPPSTSWHPNWFRQTDRRFFFRRLPRIVNNTIPYTSNTIPGEDGNFSASP